MLVHQLLVRKSVCSQRAGLLAGSMWRWKEGDGCYARFWLDTAARLPWKPSGKLQAVEPRSPENSQE